MSSFISVDFLLFRAFLPFRFLRLFEVPLVLSFQGKNEKNPLSLRLIYTLQPKKQRCIRTAVRLSKKAQNAEKS